MEKEELALAGRQIKGIERTLAPQIFRRLLARHDPGSGRQAAQGVVRSGVGKKPVAGRLLGMLAAQFEFSGVPFNDDPAPGVERKALKDVFIGEA